jgi:hypothetical protein
MVPIFIVSMVSNKKIIKLALDFLNFWESHKHTFQFLQFYDIITFQFLH